MQLKDYTLKTCMLLDVVRIHEHCWPRWKWGFKTTVALGRGDYCSPLSSMSSSVRTCTILNVEKCQVFDLMTLMVVQHNGVVKPPISLGRPRWNSGFLFLGTPKRQKVLKTSLQIKIGGLDSTRPSGHLYVPNKTLVNLFTSLYQNLLKRSHLNNVSLCEKDKQWCPKAGTALHWNSFSTSASVWPDFAKFHHFGKYLKKSLGTYLRLIWFWAKFSTHFGPICMLWGKFSSPKMAKYWKHNLVNWSHWLGAAPSLIYTFFSQLEISFQVTAKLTWTIDDFLTWAELQVG